MSKAPHQELHPLTPEETALRKQKLIELQDALQLSVSKISRSLRGDIQNKINLALLEPTMREADPITKGLKLEAEGKAVFLEYMKGVFRHMIRFQLHAIKKKREREREVLFTAFDGADMEVSHQGWEVALWAEAYNQYQEQGVEADSQLRKDLEIQVLEAILAKKKAEEDRQVMVQVLDCMLEGTAVEVGEIASVVGLNPNSVYNGQRLLRKYVRELEHRAQKKLAHDTGENEFEKNDILFAMLDDLRAGRLKNIQSLTNPVMALAA